MIRFLTMRPVASMPLLLAPHFAVSLVALLVFWHLSPGHAAEAAKQVCAVMGFACPCAAAFLLVCLRKRVGLPEPPVLFLIPLAPVQLWGHVAVLAAVMLSLQPGSWSDGTILMDYFVDMATCADGLVPSLFFLPWAGTTVGALAGRAFANQRLRSGRWHHIVPAE